MDELLDKMVQLSARFNKANEDLLKHWQESIEEFQSITAAIMADLTAFEKKLKKIRDRQE